MLRANVQTARDFSLVRRGGRISPAEDAQARFLRQLIWLYFALLIAEGVLRKWVVPSLSAPLLVIRDPLVLLIYLQAVRCRRFPINGEMVAYFVLLSGFILLALVQIILEIGGGPLVALYGLRTNFLHLPLIFVIPQVFSYADVVKVGRWVLILSVPMAGLMIWQFLSPPNSWINAATIAEGQQLVSAMGRIRPAAVFSFSSGAGHFFEIATAFLIYGWAQPRAGYSPWLLGAGLLSVAVVQPVSGSRALVLACSLVVIAAAVFAILNGSRAQRIISFVALIIAAMAALSMTSFFREALTVFMTRWDEAGGGNAAQSLSARVLGGFADPFYIGWEIGPLGMGIGLGTNVGSALMNGSQFPIRFLLAEGEWARMVMEAGPILGFSFLAYRTWIACGMALRAMSAATRQNLLAWLLAWGACRSLLNEQLSQPTNLGFMVLSAGLCLATMPRRRLAYAEDRATRNAQVVQRGLRLETQFPK